MTRSRTSRASSVTPSRARRAAGRTARTQPTGPSRGRSGAQIMSVASFVRRRERTGDVTLDCDGVPVTLTHLDRVYWPADGITKGDLLAYYARVARYILPHLADRPAILKRHPNGIDAPPFFQHDVRNPPAFIQTISLATETGRPLDYAVYDGLASLLYLTNLGTIAHNPWLSRVGSLDQPDFLALDLDPHGAPFQNVLEVARSLHEVLTNEGLRGYAKTSGSAGIHVFVPLAAEQSYETVMDVAGRLARATAAAVPKIATVERRIAERRTNQVYVDWQQNARGKSVASVYSVRATPGATVSAPVTWTEIDRGFRITDFTLATMPERIRTRGDLWASMATDRQRLTP